MGRNVSNAYMEAVGDILVGGNIISSKVIAGGGFGPSAKIWKRDSNTYLEH